MLARVVSLGDPEGNDFPGLTKVVPNGLIRNWSSAIA